MQISYNWLKEYVDFQENPQQLAELLTFLGLEVETIKEVGQDLETILVGEVLFVKPHPHSDKLVISQVQVDSKTLTVVVGADNMQVGDKVPVAIPGSHLPFGQTIKEQTIKGVTSQGMLCSAYELNLSEEKDEILILPKDAKVGEPLGDSLRLHDYILSLGLTPNYGHCLSLLGVAREVGAKLGEKLKYREPLFPQRGRPVQELASILIEDPILCPRYSARIIMGVNHGPSPFWMQQRLRSAGVRPISQVVDVTNYVMLELGQPLHAFDYDKIHQHQIIVRRAKGGEHLMTLDGEERELLEDDLLISDPREAIALAGVMGGLKSEVTKETSNILLESAHFHPTTIRKTSRRLGLPSEASHRFERGVDIGGTCRALDRALELLTTISSGEVSPGVIDVYPNPRGEQEVSLRIDRVEKVLGLSICKSQVRTTLQSLGFKVKGDETFYVQIPSYRMDMEGEIDLIEEVARHYGYHKIPEILPQSMGQGRLTPFQKMERKTRSLIGAMGLWEIITYSFVNPNLLKDFHLKGDEDQWLKLKNPLNEELSVMRTSLLPGLVETFTLNQNRHQEKVSLYELGKVFSQGPEGRKEAITLGALSSQDLDVWGHDSGSFYYLKGVLEGLFRGLGVETITYERGEIPFLHPGRQALLLLEGEGVGFLGEIHLDLRNKYGLRRRPACFQLELTPLWEKGERVISYEPIPRFPSINRDLALVVDEAVTSQQIYQILRESGGELLKEIRVFDLYRGPQLKEGKKSLAYQLTFFSHGRTLKDEEVDKLVERMVIKLGEELEAHVRD